MNKYLLPRGYLSWSAMDLWMSNPDRFRREYFENGKRLDTKFLQFGKGIAKMIERVKEFEKKHKNRAAAVKELAALEGWDENTIEVFLYLDIYDEPEYKIEVIVQEVPLLSYVDSYDDMFHKFMEYKTGKHPWDQAKVQKHGQLLFYAVALRKLKGQTPWGCDLVWIETAENSVEGGDFWSQVDKKLALTGKTKSFHREFDEREIDRMEAAIVQVAGQISEAYKKFIEEI